MPGNDAIIWLARATWPRGVSSQRFQYVSKTFFARFLRGCHRSTLGETGNGKKNEPSLRARTIKKRK